MTTGRDWSALLRLWALLAACLVAATANWGQAIALPMTAGHGSVVTSLSVPGDLIKPTALRQIVFRSDGGEAGGPDPLPPLPAAFSGEAALAGSPNRAASQNQPHHPAARYRPASPRAPPLPR